jgi:DNA-binding NarL/FixJ family response regulator
MKRIRLILADDHTMVREGLQLLLDSQPDMQVVALAGDGSEILTKVRGVQPDCVVMDLAMPNLNGLEATEKLKAEHPQVKIIALTFLEDANYFRQLVNSGVDGYVLKRSVGTELIHAIQSVAQGQVYFDAALAFKALRNSNGFAANKGHAASAELSEQEKKVLTLLAWGHGQKEIAARLELSVKTVDTYKGRILKKLGLSSRSEMVQYALRRGWLHEEGLGSGHE